MNNTLLVIFLFSIIFGGCVGQTNTSPIPNICGKTLYADNFVNSPLNKDFEVVFDYDEALACAKANDKKVLLYFTGWASVMSKKMEETVFTNPKVAKLIKDQFVLAALYVDDHTKLKTPYNRKLKKTDRRRNTTDRLGRKHSYIQSDIFKAGEQPYLLIINSDGEILQTALEHKLDATIFYDWLLGGK